MGNLGEFIFIKPYEDKRGMLKKIIMKSQLEDENIDIGEVYVLFSTKDSVRGNHYHKKTVEYFTVISGKAKVALMDLSHGVHEEFYLCADDNVVLKTPPYLAHAFKNEFSEPLIILAVSSKEYSPSDPDTYINVILQ